MGALLRRGPDGAAVRIDGPTGLAHAALHTTPESAGAVQPLASAGGRHVITFDGRLDNRDEIIDALGPPAGRTFPDAALVLQAYDAWGEGAVERLVGDFAFALWDAPNRRLLCARDALGIRPFYYHLGDDVFCCASELQAVLVLDEVRARVGPNEGYLAEHLAARPTQREDTVFDGIRRLPAARTRGRSGRRRLPASPRAR